VELAQACEGGFGEFVLPGLGGAVAEVDAAAQWFHVVDAAEVALLEGAAAVGSCAIDVCGGGAGGGAEAVEGEGGFESGDVEAVAVGLEVAASARGPAGWPAAGDLGDDVGVDVVDGLGDLGVRCGVEPGLGAPVVFGGMLEDGAGGYRAFAEVLDEAPRGNADELVPRIATLYRASLEAVVRTAPEQYLWTHRLWKTPPPTGP